MPSEPISLEVLLKYAAGELSGDEAAAVERLTAGSADSRKALSRIQELRTLMLADDSQAAPARAIDAAKAVFVPPGRPGIVEQIKRFVGELVFDSRSEAALAGLRGGDDGFQLSYHSSVAEIDVECLPGAEGDWRLRGQVTPTVAAPSAIELTGPQKTLTATTDENGGFALELAPGEYEFRLIQSGVEVVFPPIALE